MHAASTRIGKVSWVPPPAEATPATVDGLVCPLRPCAVRRRSPRRPKRFVESGAVVAAATLACTPAAVRGLCPDIASTSLSFVAPRTAPRGEDRGELRRLHCGRQSTPSRRRVRRHSQKGSSRASHLGASSLHRLLEATMIRGGSGRRRVFRKAAQSASRIAAVRNCGKLGPKPGNRCPRPYAISRRLESNHAAEAATAK